MARSVGESDSDGDQMGGNEATSRRSKLIVYGRVGSRRRYTVRTKRLRRVISEREGVV